MTYHWVCNKSNTMGAASGAETTYPFGAPEFTAGFSGVSVARSLVFCVSLFSLLVTVQGPGGSMS